MDLSDFARITAPTLVLQGDQDEVRVEHSAAVVGHLPAGPARGLPGTHALPVERPALVNLLIGSFLQGEAPTTLGSG